VQGPVRPVWQHGVGSALVIVKTLADDSSALHHHRANQRIGMCASHAAARQFQRAQHVRIIVCIDCGGAVWIPLHRGPGGSNLRWTVIKHSIAGTQSNSEST
jgi:hypothetical protein